MNEKTAGAVDFKAFTDGLTNALVPVVRAFNTAVAESTLGSQAVKFSEGLGRALSRPATASEESHEPPAD